MKFVGDIIRPIIWTANKKGVRRMEKVDALIEALAEHIDLVESVIGIPVER